MENGEPSPTVKRACEFLGRVADLLIEKNKKYGDAAANPMRVFSHADPVEQIKVRIDDKLSRLKTVGTGEQTDEDTLMDLVGYLALLHAAQTQPIHEKAAFAQFRQTHIQLTDRDTVLEDGDIGVGPGGVKELYDWVSLTIGEVLDRETNPDLLSFWRPKNKAEARPGSPT